MEMKEKKQIEAILKLKKAEQRKEFENLSIRALFLDDPSCKMTDEQRRAEKDTYQVGQRRRKPQ